jgi:1-acyl-sn-glycerol-3-phosphate acyltransferase
MLLLRSALFNLLFYLLTAVLVVLALPVLLLPRGVLMRLLRSYAWFMLGLLRLICGTGLRVTGEGLLPKAGAALIAAKHQSAFDTLVWLLLLPDACYVLKRELLLIPVWGWLARKARMIAVDRKAGGKAMRRLLADAQAAAREGRQIVIFPEGTRVAPGQRIPYQPGIAGLAGALKLPVLPVATDSGRYWPRRSFARYPGIVTVAILPALPLGLGRQDLLTTLERAIETESERLLEHGKVCG